MMGSLGSRPCPAPTLAGPSLSWGPGAIFLSALAPYTTRSHPFWQFPWFLDWMGPSVGPPLSTPPLTTPPLTGPAPLRPGPVSQPLASPTFLAGLQGWPGEGGTPACSLSFQPPRTCPCTALSQCPQPPPAGPGRYQVWLEDV